ncbi:MAG TPA: class I SAM-dependent methyltransferase [Acidimicrobiia bacterium]|nr:class I SAM-dependent methyltransferase [Acidimicrobiia bacterium]
MKEPSPLGAGADHWNTVHEARPPEMLTWYQPNPQNSLDLIGLAGLSASQRIVDVGGGSSLLCDRLIEIGYRDVTVIDVSAAAIAHVRSRIGPVAGPPTLVEGDIGGYRSERNFDLWHDRAVFHFLTDAEERRVYLDSLAANLTERGHVVLATFGLRGPDTCSGLPVRKYGPDDLEDALGDQFEPLAFREEAHTTPTGGTQHFLYGLFRRSG